VCATVEDAKFQPGRIGAAGLFDVVEHIENDVSFLGGLHSLMRPGGRLYLTVPAFQALWSSEDEYAGHHRRYSTRTLGASLRQAGFEVEYISYFFWFHTLPVFLLRTVPSFLGLRQNKPAENHAREHSTGSGLVSRVVDGLLDFERRRLRLGKRMPFGGSCFAVARRVQRP
jgi:SAM-dependent methyltransferase